MKTNFDYQTTNTAKAGIYSGFLVVYECTFMTMGPCIPAVNLTGRSAIIKGAAAAGYCAAPFQTMVSVRK